MKQSACVLVIRRNQGSDSPKAISRRTCKMKKKGFAACISKITIKLGNFTIRCNLTATLPENN